MPYNMQLSVLDPDEPETLVTPLDLVGVATPMPFPIWLPGQLYGGVHQMMPASKTQMGVLYVQPNGSNPADMKLAPFRCKLTPEQHELALSFYQVRRIELKWTWDSTAAEPVYYVVTWNPENREAYKPTVVRGWPIYIEAEFDLRYLRELEV